MHNDDNMMPPFDSSESSPMGATDTYDYFPLDVRDDIRLLPDEHELVLNHSRGQILLVNWERRRFVAEASFTREEGRVLATLLEAWPHYVPYERVLQVLHPQQLPHHIVQQVETARREGTMDALLLPVRTLLLACQERMNRFGIKIVAVYEHGYLLIPLER